MKASQFVVAGLVCLAASACRSDPNVPILERELRLQEDQMYQLRDNLEDSQVALESCRRENALLRNRLQGGAASTEARESSAPALGAGPRAPAEAAPLAPPAINLGAPEPAGTVPESLKNRSSAPPLDKAPLPEPRRLGSPPGPSAELLPGPVLPGVSDPGEASSTSSSASNAGSGDLPVAKGNSGKVRKIMLNESLTGGYNGGGRDGDAGLMVMIEPRDSQGKYVDAPADISVVVVDPALQGETARVGRWDFSAQEVASLFRATALGKGIDLEMPWPAGPPAHTDLHLFVRYTTADGRKLEVERAIKIDRPRDLSTRWVPADRPVPKASNSSSGKTAQTPEPRPRAPASSGRPTRAARPQADRSDEPSPRTAALPSWRDHRGSSESPEPLQRPVWSPERR